MRRLVLAVLAAAAIGVTGCVAPTPAPPSIRTPVAAPPESRPATQTSLAASLPPLPGPGEWAPEITNPYFPFAPGTTFVYKGEEDGKPTVDTVVVTARKKTVLGVTATVVHDTLTSGGRKIEQTDDWYAQDIRNNVWYLGEDTRTFDSKGNVNGTEGSWEAGVAGAKAGLFMPAQPKVGDSFYQEFWPGYAEDAFKVVGLDGTVTVPYGKYDHLLVTEETTVLEPDVVSRKYYASGVGQVYELDVRGSSDYGKLVSVTRK